MATTQARTLVNWLREIGAKPSHPRKRLSARTPKNKHGEFGSAVSYIEPLSADQESRLIEKSQYIEILKCCTGRSSEFWVIRF